MDKLAIFIDAAYFKKLQELVYNTRVDYEKFAAEIYEWIKQRTLSPLDLLRTYYYDALPYQHNPPIGDESNRYASARRLFYTLNKLPKFSVREGRCVCRGKDGSGEFIYQQKKTDLMLGLDIAVLSTKKQISQLVLVSGDSDLVPAIEVAKNEGIGVWLFHGPTNNGQASHAKELWTVCDDRYEMDKAFIEKCKLNLQKNP